MDKHGLLTAQEETRLSIARMRAQTRMNADMIQQSRSSMRECLAVLSYAKDVTSKR